MGLKVRDSNVELLRILAILGVVILHYNGLFAFTSVASGSINSYILQGAEALFICAVDLFLLISGYFSCTSGGRKAVKVFDLLFQVIVFGLVRYLVSVLFFHSPFSARGLISAFLPNNYFVTLYLVIYLLSPYINRAVRGLSERKFRTLLVLCFVLFSVLPTLLDIADVFGVSLTGMYPTGTFGSGYGYSVIQFALMYLLGAYLCRFGAERKKTSPVWFCVFAASFVAVFFLQFFLPQIARSYSNPFVILLAVSLFVLFRSFSFQNRAVNLFAKSAFTGFLLHDLFLPYLGIEKIVNGNPLILVVHMVLSAVGIYLLCWLIWWVYHFLSRPILTFANKILSPLDSYLSVDEDGERS